MTCQSDGELVTELVKSWPYLYSYGTLSNVQGILFGRVPLMVRSCHTDKGIMSCKSDDELATNLVESWGNNACVKVALVSWALCWCAALCTVFFGLPLTFAFGATIVHLSHHRTSITAYQSHALSSPTSHTNLPPKIFIPCLARGTRTSAALSPKMFGRATWMVSSCHTYKVS